MACYIEILTLYVAMMILPSFIQPNIWFWRRCHGCHDGNLGYLNRVTLANLIDPFPPTSFSSIFEEMLFETTGPLGHGSLT